eukprot:7385109-Prymnesium_polylepis.1
MTDASPHPVAFVVRDSYVRDHGSQCDGRGHLHLQRHPHAVDPQRSQLERPRCCSRCAADDVTADCRGYLEMIYAVLGVAISASDPTAGDIGALLSGLVSCMCDAGAGFLPLISA